MRRFTPRLGRLLLFAVLALALFVNASTPSSATTCTPTGGVLAGSTFEGADGNLAVDCPGFTPGFSDWATPAPNLQIGSDKPSGPTDNSFGQGTKEDTLNPTIVSGSIPPNKNDLTRYYVGSEFTGGQNYLYLAWERIANIGSVDVDFELNQSSTKAGNGVTPVRTAGDALVTYDFSGSATPTIGVARWVTSGTSRGTCMSGGSAPCWGPITALTSTAEAAVNAGTITDPISTTSTTLTQGLFGEAAINLTAVGLFHAGTCTAFGSAYLKSRSSSSFTSEIKDFIAPKSVTISNCGEVKIIKHTDTRGIDKTFSFTSTITGTASFTLNDKGNSTADSVGNTRDITNVVPGTYSVTEGAEPTGFALESLICTPLTGSSSGHQDSVPAQADITVAADSVVTCTYTNNQLLPTPSPTASPTPSPTASPTASPTPSPTASPTPSPTPKSPSISTTLVTASSVSVGGAVQNTTLSAATANIGDSVHDTAALSGATVDASGTVTYTVYTDSACTTPYVNQPNPTTVTVTGGSVPASSAVTFNSAGIYYWQAVYSGDNNNNGTTDACTAEQLVVNPNAPSISTQLSATTPVTIGTAVHDTAALSGATVDASGTVTYTVFSDSTCSTQVANVVQPGTVTVTNGAVPDSDPITPTTAGTYYWQAVYSGDNNNNPATSPCTEEQLVVNPNTPATSTAQNLVPNDTATISGATPNAGGTITFNLFSPGNPTCDSNVGQPAFTQTVNVSGSGPYTTTNTTPVAGLAGSVVGTWNWQVVYSGDANNSGTPPNCGVEHFSITNG